MVKEDIVSNQFAKGIFNNIVMTLLLATTDEREVCFIFRVMLINSIENQQAVNVKQNLLLQSLSAKACLIYQNISLLELMHCKKN